MAHPLSVPEGTTWRDARTASVVSLIVANLVPLFGALFFGWTIGVIVVLYWCETAVIGLYSILKLPFAVGWGALFSVPFFIVHFGTFLAITGVLAVGLYHVVDEVAGKGLEVLRPIRFELIIFIPVMVVSHGVSFVTNFIGKKEYEWTDDESPHARAVPARGGHIRERLLGCVRGTHQ